MSRSRISLLLMVVLASGLIAAGCGDDDDGGGDDSVSVPTISVPDLNGTETESTDKAEQQTTEAPEAIKPPPGSESQPYITCLKVAGDFPEPQRSAALKECEKLNPN